MPIQFGRAAVLAAAALFISFPAFAADPTGLWLTQEKDAKVRIAKCGKGSIADAFIGVIQQIYHFGRGVDSLSTNCMPREVGLSSSISRVRIGHLRPRKRGSSRLKRLVDAAGAANPRGWA